MKKHLHILYLLAFVGICACAARAQQPVPRRIISVSPNITEILYAVGAFDRVVAVSDYCTYPPAVKNLPRVGGWETSNIEKIAALRPDLVILTEAQNMFLGDKLQQLGMRTLVIPSQTVADIFTAIGEIGRVTGTEARASEIVRQTRATIERVRSVTTKLGKPGVLFVVDRTPGTLRDLTAVAQGSFLSELVDIAGGRLISAPSKIGYVKLSKELIVSLNPDIIVDLVHWYKGELSEDLKLVWRDLPELRAVQTGRVYPVHDEFIPHASQFVAETAQLLLKLIHPEAVVEAGRRVGK
jgi:iron complex transport system substrate-binding protein